MSDLGIIAISAAESIERGRALTVQSPLAVCRIIQDAIDFACAEHKARISELLKERAALLEAGKGNWWAWQGDGLDHLESLVCPVLIRADKLKAIIDGKEPTKITVDQLHALEKTLQFLQETEGISHQGYFYSGWAGQQLRELLHQSQPL